MSRDLVDQIARAVLYEGYILYPYRRSSIRNRQRWNFGVLYPQTWAAEQTGSDRSHFQMECPALGDDQSRLDLTVRFLHLLTLGEGDQAWQEAVEREVVVNDLPLVELASQPYRIAFTFPASVSVDENTIRRQELIQGEVSISASLVRPGLFKVSVQVRNTTALDAVDRNEALLRSLASAHAVLNLRGGELVSVTDPPDALRELTASCTNVGVWPVLVGEEGSRHTMLGSPIILYDYPRVAPETDGDLFDGTEIDEILILRILTLTDKEREEMRNSSEHSRRILERIENLPAERLMDLHGAVRCLRTVQQPDPWNSWDTWAETPRLRSVHVGGIELRKGDRVRLRPAKRADIFDTVLEGKIAVVESIEQDFENAVHLAVTLEDDPGHDLGELRQPGHRFFFSLSEVEPVAATGEQRSA